MKTEETIKLAELIEQTSHVAKLLIESEQALGEGNLLLTQKSTKEASKLLQTLVGDVMAETVLLLQLSGLEACDYDMPSNHELAKQLVCINIQAGLLIGLLCENQSTSLIKQTQNTLSKHMNTVKELYEALYAN